MMPDHGAFTYTEPALLPVLEELRQREPIFHTPAFGTSRAEFDLALAPDYWEVGASGRRYSRAFILDHLYKEPPVLAESAAWKTWEHALRQLSPDVYLITYVLQQGERVTRRSTVWERVSVGWRVLYHQGTIVTSDEDERAP